MLVVLVWGMNFAAIQIGVAGIPPLLLGALRFLLVGAGLVLIGSAHGVSMPLGGFALTLAAAVTRAEDNIVTRNVGRFGPMNQQAFVMWASLVRRCRLFCSPAGLRGRRPWQMRAHTFSGLRWLRWCICPGVLRCLLMECGRAFFPLSRQPGGAV
jgi:drug/metabolite transporter (DMT)-like permease